MTIRRGELLLMFLTVLALNWLATLWWLSDGSLRTAWASGAAQAAPQAEDVVQATAAIPRTFSYQGTLRDAAGALINGNRKLTLRIYNVVSGGSALYTEIFDPVFVRSGVFSVVVGDQAGNVIPANLFDNEKLFLGLAVGSDAEMQPRQRLHPVPWAMQSSTAVSAVTANNLARGGGVSGILSFGTGGAKEIAFVGGGKISDAPTGMTLTSPAFALAGDVAVGGDLTVDGDWSASAIRHVGNSNDQLPASIVKSTYPVSINRYVVEASDNGASPDTVAVDDALLIQLCGDEDGCSFTLGMRNWEPTFGNGLIASQGPYRFSLTSTVNNKRFWDARQQNGTPAHGGVGTAEDGNSVVQHVAQAWDCYFTDSQYINGSTATDTAIGFGLLNWHTTFLSTGMTCVLIIED